MNYLAHLYLSGEDEELIVGNFIGDHVKGNHYLHFPAKVQEGILLHRQIDSFTDQHPVVRDCGRRFHTNYGRYSGIVTDVIFDHFLASGWQRYAVGTLRQFSKHVHAILLSKFIMLPLEVKLFLPFLVQHKRLESYAGLEGIYQSLAIMGRRTSLPQEAGFALRVLQQDYQPIKDEFEQFFPELVSFVENNFGVEIRKPS